MAKFKYKPTRLMLPTSEYDQKRADFAVDFISMLKHVNGEWYGQPFILMPWQEQIIRDIFGVVDKKTKLRQFKTAYVEICKKMGKSELAAAIALYLLLADGERGAEVYSAAADVAQASIVYNTAKAMVELSPSLAKVCKLVPSTKRILFNHTNSFYRVLSSETKSKQGFNISGLIFDELFAQQTRDLYDTLTKYTSDARRQPLHFLITTAGRDKNSVCYEVHTKAKDILSGQKVDPTFYPLIFGMEDGEDWTDWNVIKRVNPSLGITIKEDVVKLALEQAKQNPAEELHFRQFRLNEWCNADIRWLPMDKWAALGEELDFSEYEGADCYCGLDLSSQGDLTSLVCVFPPMGGDNKYTVMPFYWLPKNAIELRTKRDHVPYAVWEKTGAFFTTEGDVVDYDYIVEFIKRLSQRFSIKEIAYDRWGAEKIRRDLEEVGEENGFEVFPFGQGYGSMSPSSKQFYQLLLEGKLRHAKHPTLTWNLANTIIETDAAGNIKPSKRKSTEKIDGTVALIMAMSRATLQSAGNGGVAYADGRDMLFL
jgi:phage terminase large subunit-like protein